MLLKEQRFTTEELVALEESHERIAVVRGKAYAKIGQDVPAGAVAYEVVYRAPKPAEYKAVRAMANDKAQAHGSTEALARRLCVAVRPFASFDELLTKYPAVAEASQEPMMELAGFASGGENALDAAEK